MQKARVANPGPAGLLVINPKRGNKMATKRRRKAARPATTSRRKTTTRRRSNPTVFSSSRKRVTRRRRSVARRRNPSTGGLLSQAAGLAAGITAVGLIGSFIPPIGGVSPFAVAGRQAATGWLVGEGMQRFNVMRQYASDVKLAGFALGIGTIIGAYVMPTVSGFLRPAPKAQPATNGANGMGDIVTLPRGSWDDYYGSTPMFNTNPGSGMNGLNGVVTIPRRATGY